MVASRSPSDLRLDAQQFFTPEHPPEHLESILKRNRFDGSIAVARNAEETRWFLNLAEEHDFIRGVVGTAGWPGARRGDPQPHPKLKALAWVGEEPPESAPPLPLETASIDAAFRMAGRFPNLRIAVVDLGGPALGQSAGIWARALECAARYPNVFVKASGLLRLAPKPWKAPDIRPFVQHALRVFGPERMMFGSDWPSGLPDSIWKESLALFTQAIGAQSIASRDELLGGTAHRFYALD